MADTNGRTGSDLIRDMISAARGFDFFRVIRLLELSLPDRAPIGHDAAPQDEIVHIRPDASFRFPPGAIARISFDDESSKKPASMTISFFGLYGRYGTLPWHYTSRIIHIERPSIADRRFPDSGLRAFIDIFNHRLTSLFYRAGVKYRWPLTFRIMGKDEATNNLIAFTGLGTRHLRNRFSFPDSVLLRYAGIFMAPPSASSLATLLSDFLGVLVRVGQFQGEWLHIEEDDRNRIGFIKGNNRLNHNFTIGNRIFSRQHRFRIIIGPIDFNRFTTLLPTQEAFQRMCMLVRLRAGVSMKFDCAIMVKKKTVPGIALGKKFACLGRTLFLLSHERKGKITSPVFSIK
jgi:type VI secretion system protein ImpH